jgi:hypothetical protein
MIPVFADRDPARSLLSTNPVAAPHRPLGASGGSFASASRNICGQSCCAP